MKKKEGKLYLYWHPWLVENQSPYLFVVVCIVNILYHLEGLSKRSSAIELVLSFGLPNSCNFFSCFKMYMFTSWACMKASIVFWENLSSTEGGYHPSPFRNHRWLAYKCKRFSHLLNGNLGCSHKPSHERLRSHPLSYDKNCRWRRLVLNMFFVFFSFLLFELLFLIG